jgi:hypothetical protein
MAAGSSPTIVVAGDSVVASSLPSFGQTTLLATRPDALTGKPVVIGLFSGTGNPFTPFSVNTTTPTPVNSSGDCWQKGALSRALTPNLLQGDTVTLSQSAGFFAGTGNTTSATVPASRSDTVAGPQAGCASLAPWARNAITSAPRTVTDGPIAVSGLAQPLATGVSVSASDGTKVSAPVSVTPAADGSWSATIPAAKLAGLGNTTLNVTPVVAVPDVSTGAPAHIAGVGATVTKSAAPDANPQTSASPGGSGQPGPAGGHSGTSPRMPASKPRVTMLRSAAKLTIAAARRNGIPVSFRVPAGATMVEVELLHGSKPVYMTIARAGKAGSRQTVRLSGSRVNRLLGRGHYTIAVKAGTSRSNLGAATTLGLSIR